MCSEPSNQNSQTDSRTDPSRTPPYWIWAVGLACITALAFGVLINLRKGESRAGGASRAVTSNWQAVPELLRTGRIEQAKAIVNQDTSTDRPPDELILFGLLCGYLNDSEHCARLLNRAAAELPSPATDVTYNLLQEKLDLFGFSREDLYRIDFDLEDAQYVYRSFLYRCIAEGVLAGVPEGLPQANALVGWTRRMIAPSHPDTTVVLPITILARGFGTADQMCWTLLTIARQKGIFGFMVYLWNPERNESVHTICQIYPGGKPMLCDPYYGIVLSRPTGEPQNLFWVNKELSPLQHYPPYRDGLARCFEQARVAWWPLEAQSVLSRMKFLQQYAGELPLTPVFFQNADEEMDVIRKYFWSLPGGKTLYEKHRPDIALYPFSVRSAMHDPERVKAMNETMKRYRPLSQFRLLHLQSQFQQAERGYTEILENSDSLETREIAAIFKAECLLEMGKLEEGRQLLTGFIAANPNSSWLSQARYYLVMAERALETAAGHSEDVSGSTDQSPTLSGN